MITFSTTAQKYTGALTGDYTGSLPPPESAYTRMLSAIINGTDLPIPQNRLLRTIYKLYGGDVDIEPPDSPLNAVIQCGVYPDRYTITNDDTESRVTISDSVTDVKYFISLADPLIELWLKVVQGGVTPTPDDTDGANFRTSDGFFIRTADGYIYNVAAPFDTSGVLSSVGVDAKGAFKLSKNAVEVQAVFGKTEG